MNLSSLVHVGRHQIEPQSSRYEPRPQRIMSSSMIANQYAAQAPVQNTSYAYVNAPQPPPSPPVDEATKCSLPSISSLLGMADAGSPQEQGPRSPQHETRERKYLTIEACHSIII